MHTHSFQLQSRMLQNTIAQLSIWLLAKLNMNSTLFPASLKPTGGLVLEKTNGKRDR